jgi:hypothetical protein
VVLHERSTETQSQDTQTCQRTNKS